MNNLQITREKKIGTLKKLEPKYKSKIGFSTQEGIHIVFTKDILFLHALGNYTEVHLMSGRKIIVSKTLKLIEELLPDSGFRRCHQSFVINLDQVVLFRDSIFLSNNKEIPISRRKRK